MDGVNYVLYTIIKIFGIKCSQTTIKQQYIIIFLSQLMFAQIIIALITIVILRLLFKYIARPYYYMRTYAKIPNSFKLDFVPLVGPFITLQSFFEKYGDSFYLTKKMAEMYPDARFIVTNLLDKLLIIVQDPEMLKDYYLKKENHYVKFQFAYINKARVFGLGVAFAQGQEWKRRRKIATNLFHFQFFQRFNSKIDQTIDQIIQQIQFNNKEVKQVATLNSMEFAAKIAGEVIVKCFFGYDLHKRKVNGQSITVAMNKLISEVALQEQTLWYFLFGSKFFNLNLRKSDKIINQKIQQIRKIGKQIVKEKLNNQNKNQQINIVSMIIDKGYLNKTTDVYITEDELIDQFFTFFVGGMDTTAHLLNMCLYYLCIYPQIQQKLKKQIDSYDEIQLSDLSKLTYLDAFVNQANRHYGFMVSIFPRIAVQDHYLADVKILKGTVVTFGWLTNYYHHKYFQNPYQFNPDRWYNSEAQKKYQFTPFSTGKRSCIGKHLALIEIKKVIIKMVRQFEMSLSPGYNLRLIMRSLYEPYDPIMLNLKKRSK